jgi:hypothetical protein
MKGSDKMIVVIVPVNEYIDEICQGAWCFRFALHTEGNTVAAIL